MRRFHHTGSALALAAASIVSLSYGEARAAPPATRLIYTRALGAEACPDERSFRAMLAQEVGSDPFVEEGPSMMVITIHRRDRTFEIIATRLNQDGMSVWSHAPFRGPDCEKAVKRAALAAIIELFPAPSPTPPVEPSKLGLRAAVAASMIAGLLPSPRVDIAAGFGARLSLFSIKLEAHVAPPISYDTPAGRATAMLVGGTLAPCLHWRVLVGCALVFAGAVRSVAEAYLDKGGFAPFVGVGGRLGTEIPFTRYLAFSLGVDVLGTALRPGFKSSSAPEEANACVSSTDGPCFFRASPVFMNAGVGLVGLFGG